MFDYDDDSGGSSSPDMDPAFDVQGLTCPYLGLRHYTYDDRAMYAGRHHDIDRGVDFLTRPGEQRTLLFVTGVSGSGKSSFVQAGLLPALEEHYQKEQVTIRSAIFRPSYTPMNNLVSVLLKMGIPAGMLHLDDVHEQPDKLSLFIAHTTLPDQVNILIIDQFDEIFTLSEADQRQAFFTFLATLPAFQDVRTHIIAPIRSEHLPDLFHSKALFDSFTHAIDLREMTEDELKQVIERPLKHMYPELGKRFQDQLLQRLTQEASVNASYLPMLQVELENIWRQGTLTLDAYESLTYSIENRANSVYRYIDYDGDHRYERPDSDRQLIMEILLDLVDTSLDDNMSRDYRRRRTVTDLSRGSTTFARRPAQFQYSLFSSRSKKNSRVKTWDEMSHDHEQKKIDRSRLIEELYKARLLMKSEETQGDITVDMIEIVHESLINHWERLQQAVEGQRSLVQQRRRVEQFVHSKMSADKIGPRLLEGIQLDETLAMIERGDLILATPEARELLQQSIKKRQQRRWVTRSLMAVLGVLLVVVGLVGFALGQGSRRSFVSLQGSNQQQTASATAERGDNQEGGAFVSETQQAMTLQTAIAAQQTTEALQKATIEKALLLKARELTLVAESKLSEDPELGVLLAIEAARIDQSVAVENILRQAIRISLLRLNLRGHRDIVWSASYSPDGRRIVTVSDDQTASIWDATTGEELVVLRGHDSGVWSASFSSDGLRVVTASEDQTARVWDATTGEPLLVINDPDGRVNSAVFSPDGTMILTAGDTQAARLWDATTGEQIRVFEGGSGARQADFSPDGERIVTANYDQRVRLWNTETAELYFSLYGHKDVVWSAIFSSDGKQIVTTSADETVRLWDANSGTETRSIPETRARNASFSPNGQQIVTAEWDNTARVWDVSSGDLVTVLSGHTSVVNSAEFSPDGQRIVTASSDRKVRVWDAGMGTEVFALLGHEEGLVSVEYDAQGQRIVTASTDTTARVWDAETGIKLFDIRGHKEPLTSASFSPDGKHIVTSSADTTARVWNAATGLEQLNFDKHEGTVWDVSYSPDNRRIVTASQDQTARVWDAETGRELVVLRGHEGSVHSAVFSQDGQFILTSSGDRTARIWEAATGREILVLRGHDGAVNSASYSMDGSRIVTASEDRMAYVWDARTGEVLLVLRGHEGSVHTAVFSPDDTRILTASSDQTSRLWDAENGLQLIPLRGHTNRVLAATFSPDGQYIASASQDRTARLYYATFQGVLGQAKRCVTRTLTDAERGLYLEPD